MAHNPQVVGTGMGMLKSTCRLPMQIPTHTKVYDITLLNGAVQVSGEFMAYFCHIMLKLQKDHRINGNFLTFIMHHYRMLFGVLKQQFQILLLAPEYDPEI
jgi:hypothetical protein